MKSFIVFTAVFAVACANSVGRAGWGSGSHKPSIDLELVAAAAAAGAGQASVGQALLEQAVGTIDAPGVISSYNGVLASVSQEEDISQLSIANKPSGSTSTINAASAENQAVGQDALNAVISGGLGAFANNSAQSESSGEGAISMEESSLNQSQTKK